MFGEAADGTNAVISLMRGNYADAALSAAAMIPVAGWAATAGKGAKYALKAADAVKAADAIKEVAKHTDEAAELSVAAKKFVENSVNAAGTGRASNKLKPDPAANGAAHSTFKTDPKTGKVINYETYEPNPRNPTGVDRVKRYDGVGDNHFNKTTKMYVDTPHVHDNNVNGGVRVANHDEIPKRRSFE